MLSSKSFMASVSFNSASVSPTQKIECPTKKGKLDSSHSNNLRSWKPAHDMTQRV